MISIFIPTYNSSDKLSETLESILSQSYKDFEVLCVDDGSTDSTPESLDRYAIMDSRIKVFRKENQGCVPFSWNYVIPHITGDFTLYMSHDDILGADALMNLVKCFNNDDSIDCVIPKVTFFENILDNPEKKYDNINTKYSTNIGKIMSGREAFLQMVDYSIPGFGLWRTSIIRNYGVPTTSFNSDEFSQRLWIKNCRKVYFSDATFGYRQSPISIVKGFKPHHIFSLDTNLRLYKEICKIQDFPIGKKNEMKYFYFQSLFYLTIKYKIHRKSFNNFEQSNLKNLINESYQLYTNTPHNPNTIKDYCYKLMSSHKFVFRIITTLRSWIIR